MKKTFASGGKQKMFGKGDRTMTKFPAAAGWPPAAGTGGRHT